MFARQDNNSEILYLLKFLAYPITLFPLNILYVRRQQKYHLLTAHHLTDTLKISNYNGTTFTVYENCTFFYC